MGTMTTKTEIDALVKANGGEPLTAEQLVEAARNKDEFPALYAHLWNVPERELAAEARLARAHKLIIALRVVTSDGTTTRMMVHTLGTKGYQPVEAVAGNLDLAAIKLRMLTADIGRARARLSSFRSVLADDVSDEIDGALRKAQETIDRATGKEAAA